MKVKEKCPRGSIISRWEQQTGHGKKFRKQKRSCKMIEEAWLSLDLCNMETF
jgi:hypothetical protein